MAIGYHQSYKSTVPPKLEVVGGQQKDGNLNFFFDYLAMIDCLSGMSCGIFVFLAVVSFFTSTELFLQSDVKNGRKLMAAVLAKKMVKPNLSQLKVCIFCKYQFLLTLTIVGRLAYLELGREPKRIHHVVEGIESPLMDRRHRQ